MSTPSVSRIDSEPPTPRSESFDGARSGATAAAPSPSSSLHFPGTPSTPSTPMTPASTGKFSAAVAAPPSLPPLVSSALWKKGSVLGGWTKRWYRFHPEHGKIFYAKGPDAGVRGEILLLTRFTVAMVPTSGASASNVLPGTFRIDCPNRDYILRADDVHVAQQWVDALTDLQRSNQKRTESLVAQTKSSATHLVTAATRCAACQTSFGLLKSKVACAACGLVFCGSLKCVEAKSLHPAAGSTAAASERCCRPCADLRDARSGGGGSDEKKLLGGMLMSNPKLKPSNSNLLIKVIAGKNLMVCDAGGSSDPYICIFFDGQEYRTEIQWKTLNPHWDQQFNIPITGASRALQIGCYDSDKYSNDDFMGMLNIPLSDLACDHVYEDWFPLKPRPGVKSDQTLGICGAIHLQLVRTESLFALFAPVFQNQLPPEEKYSQAVLKHNVKRVQTIVQSLSLAWWQAQVEDVFAYKHPIQSIVLLLAYWALVLFFPADWILPAIPILLLIKLASNYIAHQSLIIQRMEQGEAVAKELGLWGKGAEGFVAESLGGESGLGSLSSGSSSSSSAPGGGGGGLLDESAEDDLFDGESDGESDSQDDRMAALGFLGKIRQYQKQLAKIQTAIGKACDAAEALQNLFRWHDQRRSQLVAVALVVAFIFLLIVPFRLLLFLGGTAKWAKKLKDTVKRKLPKAKKPSEPENFLERSQTSVSLQPMKFHLVKKLRNS